MIDRRAFIAASAAIAAASSAKAADERLQPPVTGPLSAFISGAAEASWPAEILELGKRHILGTLAAIVACRDLPPAVAARRYALSQSGGPKGATILGTRDHAGLMDAVFANAMTGHAAEINDFSPSAFVQPGPSVVSVALGLSQTRGRSGRQMLRAVVAGYELACRMPKALGVANLRRAGLANHGIGPTFGCGAAAAILLGLPQARIGDVLSYCSEQAAGSWQWLLDTDHIEKAFVFAGMGARSGLQAALLVEAGFTGVRDNLDRKGGWMDSGIFTAAPSDLDRAYLIEALGQRFELPLVGYKRFAAGGPTQAGVQGLTELVAQVDRRRIRHVTIAMPGDVTPFRRAELPALNLPYLAAVILADGRLGFIAAQSRQRMADDPFIRELMTRVEVVSDPSQERRPRVESAKVAIRLDDGSTRETFVAQVKGFPTAPLSHADVDDKAMELLTPVLGARRSRTLANLVWSLDDLPKAGRLADALTL